SDTEIQAIYQQAAVNLPFDYSISNSGDQSVVAGSSVTNSISATLASGSSQSVSFAVSGLPAGATRIFSTTSCNPACSTLLRVKTTGATPAGNFPITITSTGGGVTRTTAFTLSVTLALTVATPTLTPNGGNFSGSVSVAMQSATSGASIYYTIDGSTPSQSSTVYTGAMTLTSSTDLKAKAFKSGSSPSTEASASFAFASVGITTGVIRYADGSMTSNCTKGDYSIANRNCSGSDGDAYGTTNGNFNNSNALQQAVNASG